MWLSPPPPQWGGAKERGDEVIYVDQFFWVFVFLQANYLVSFSTFDLPRTLPWVHMHPLTKMKVSGRSKIHYDLVLSPDFWPTRSLSVMWSLPCPRRGGAESLKPFLKQGFAPLCPCHDYYLDYCHDYYLKVFTRDKHWLFTLFLLLPPFRMVNRRLVVNALTRAHLSLISRNANSCNYPTWCPLLHAHEIQTGGKL